MSQTWSLSCLAVLCDHALCFFGQYVILGQYESHLMPNLALMGSQDVQELNLLRCTTYFATEENVKCYGESLKS